MVRGQGNIGFWILVLFTIIVGLSYGAHVIFARHGGRAIEILTYL